MSETKDNVVVEFVTLESNIPKYIATVNNSGGKVIENEKTWDIPPDLLDDYADAQFEPMMVVAVAVSVGFLIKRIMGSSLLLTLAFFIQINSLCSSH